jgi:transcriptional regulator with XRE-family HTH domain
MAALGRAGMETRDPSEIDRIVSERILARRNELAMSQPQLAERVGVTFQQVQKYENGKNRVSAGRLYEIAKALGVTIQYFYESAPPPCEFAPGRRQRAVGNRRPGHRRRA